MNKIVIAYWSGTGNTEKMANLIGEGVKEAGAEADVVDISSISADSLKNIPVFALGCPSMGAETLSDEMEEFVTQVETFSSGKKIGLFGSYGWGDGEWMREWEQRMQVKGAFIVNGEGIIVCDSPDDKVSQCLVDFGKSLVIA